MNHSNFRSFGDLGEALGRKGAKSSKGKKMTNTDKQQRTPLPEYDAVTKYYNHNKRYGFLYVTIPQSTVLEWDASAWENAHPGEKFVIRTAETDSDPGAVYNLGDTLDRDIVVESFIHGSVIERAGYREGLQKDDRIKTKVTLNDRGLQAVWTQNQEGAERNRVPNESRVANAFLKFVAGKVKTFYPERNFGFVVVDRDCETGEPLKDENGNPRTLDVHFSRNTLERASIDDVQPGDVLTLKYWTYSGGKSSVVQFKFPERDAQDQSDAA